MQVNTENLFYLVLCLVELRNVLYILRAEEQVVEEEGGGGGGTKIDSEQRPAIGQEKSK